MVVPNILSFVGRMPDYFDPNAESSVHWPIFVKELASGELAFGRDPMMAEERVCCVNFWHFVRSW